MKFIEWILLAMVFIFSVAVVGLTIAMVVALIKQWIWRRNEWRDHSADKS